jgi:hypothetical protein
MLAANMAVVVSQPRTFKGRVLSQRPMILRLAVISAQKRGVRHGAQGGA